MQAAEVPGATRARVRPLVSEEGCNVMLVTIERGGSIPVHSHTCAATMVVVRGAAHATGEKNRAVAVGDVIVKAAGEPHGFDSVDDTFEFISIANGEGILHDGEWDLKY